jgi:hypothetical protein
MSIRTTDKLSSTTACLATLALLCLSLQLQAGTLYKWVDDKGQIRYSDRLPPDQAKQQHHQLNTQGMVVGTREAAKTKEVLAAEAEAKRKEDKLLAEETRVKQVQDRLDRVLLLTFSSEEELSLVKDNRLEVLDSVIRLINNSITASREKLERLQIHAKQTYTSQDKEIPGGLAQNIEHLSRKIENRDRQRLLKQAEKDKINSQYDVDLARYRFLKASKSTSF